MSDSDDTDILLLIPPNFFLTETHLNESLTNYEMFRSNLEQTQPTKSATLVTRSSPGNQNNKSITQSSSAQQLSHGSRDVGGVVPTTPSQYQFKYRPYGDGPYTPSTSSPAVAAAAAAAAANNMSRFHQHRSCDAPLHYISSAEVLNSMYDESEKLLANRSSSSPLRPWPATTTNVGMEIPSERAACLSSKKMSDWKMSQEATAPAAAVATRKQDDDLISLTNVWNSNLDFKSNTNASTELEEERLRRRQCERNIAMLQTQLHQYQNKFTDVIKIDQAKNDTLTKLHNTNSSLSANVNELEKQISEMELRFHREKEQLLSENSELKSRIDHLKHQNIEFDRKISSILKSTNEVRDIHKEQINEIEIRLSNSKQSETLLIGEVSKLKSDNITQQAKHEAEQAKSQQTINEQSDKILRLEQEMADLIESNANSQTKESKFLEEMESQRAALKVFYQTQLDDLVRSKVDEYQKQFDDMEKSIRKETKQNERLIAERALKQIELITQKNEQEFLLLEEKHREEMELCKIRLGNATKIISQLEQELSVYRAKRRSDIAERLHNVIETQWQKTLEILTTNDASKDLNKLCSNRIVNDLEKCEKNKCSGS